MIVDVQSVKEYLPAFGYTPKDSDTIMIRHAIERVILRLKAYTNQVTLPNELKYEAINMAIGEFLFIKKSTGNLDDEDGISFKDIVRQFTEGDTNMSANMAGKDDETIFNEWLEKTRHGNPYILEHYRRLHW